MNRPSVHRLFRFRLRTLLMLPAVVAVGWFLWTWPERTIRKLESLVASGKLDEAAALVEFKPDYRYPPDKLAHQLRQPQTQPATRSLLDLALGRQPFTIEKDGVACFVDTGAHFEHVMVKSVTIERGRIKYEWGQTLAELTHQGK